MDKQVAMFEGKKIRRVWDENKEEWMFSIVDIVETLTQTDSIHSISGVKV